MFYESLLELPECNKVDRDLAAIHKAECPISISEMISRHTDLEWISTQDPLLIRDGL